MEFSNRCVTLTGDTVVLREFLTSDWIAVHEYASDPQVVKYMPWGPNTQADTHRFVEQAMARSQENPRRDYDLAIVQQASDRLIGAAGLYVSGDPPFGLGTLGYCLHRDFWGKGYGTQVAGLLLEFGFSVLRLHRIQATCDPRNIGSARVMEKNGMKREGLLRENMLTRDGWRDSYLYAILEHEWRQRHSPC